MCGICERIKETKDGSNELEKMKAKLLSELEKLLQEFADKGVLYNVHYPMNPEDIKEKGCDYVAGLKILNISYEY